jgi:hypothetical protein
VTAGSQPVRITIVGSNLSGVTQVFTTPVISPRTVAVISDQAVIVTLPAGLAAGEYGIELVSNAGSTPPGSIEVTVLPAAPPPAQAGGGSAQQVASGPPVSLQPAPVALEATPKPAAVGLPATAGPQTQPATLSGVAGPRTSPFFVFALGIAIGGVLYALWGKEGRLRVARHRGFLAQLWARPLQRLRLARVCLHCGRLHYIVQTRRDLWKAGDFCSASCFVADQEASAELASSEGVAPARLRGIGVYSDLDVKLQKVLREEASAHSATLFDSDSVHAPNGALVPALAEPETRVTVTPEPHEPTADAVVPVTVVKLTA